MKSYYLKILSLFLFVFIFIITKTNAQNDSVYVLVDELAEPNEGWEGFYVYLQQNLKYPPKARADEIHGKVVLRFVIEKEGTISQIEVIKSVNRELDQEAIRVLSQSPPWKPGKIKGQIVRTQMTLPIVFKLG
ncbi:MAG: energy transducer TonB [Cytophagales bacterium]|nr:MAG: energy transducer TonB [Cytophagales bacterium]